MPALTRRSVVLGAASLPLLSTLGPAQASPTLTITHEAFVPAELTVAVGQTFLIVNRDNAAHCMKADDGTFDLGKLASGRRVQVTFQRTGRFPYSCSLHPSMRGVLTVT